MESSSHPVLLAGSWRAADAIGTFQADNPATGEALPDHYPVSGAKDLETALAAADRAFEEVRDLPDEEFGRYLALYADRISARAEEIVAAAHQETALPISPRLKDAELPRTIGQLRQAAERATDPSWRLPTIDTAANIRSYLAPLGPIWTIGPNNFPLAFNAISGGDFAAAIGAGNPVIAKAHPAHPTTTRLLAEEAHAALLECDLPPDLVQLVYDVRPEDGLMMAADPRLGAIGFTGSRRAGVALKQAADRVGKPTFLEMSSLNPIVLLPQALASGAEAVAAEAASSCFMGTGQFCTRPGLMIAIEGEPTERFRATLQAKFEAAGGGPLLSRGGVTGFKDVIDGLIAAGAESLTSSRTPDGAGFVVAPVLLTVAGDAFLANAHAFQSEAFGPATLLVIAKDLAQADQIVRSLEGQLTGTIYAAADGSDDTAYTRLEAPLRRRVGRLMVNKMPTGVAVSPAMNHGGPFPATGHPHFTSVGLPAAMRRFTMLQCYDNVPDAHLPATLRNHITHGGVWRMVDGRMRQGSV